MFFLLQNLQQLKCFDLIFVLYYLIVKLKKKFNFIVYHNKAFPIYLHIRTLLYSKTTLQRKTLFSESFSILLASL